MRRQALKHDWPNWHVRPCRHSKNNRPRRRAWTDRRTTSVGRSSQNASALLQNRNSSPGRRRRSCRGGRDSKSIAGRAHRAWNGPPTLGPAPFLLFVTEQWTHLSRLVSIKVTSRHGTEQSIRPTAPQGTAADAFQTPHGRTATEMMLRRTVVQRFNVHPQPHSGALRAILSLPKRFSAESPGQQAWSTVTADDARFWQAESSKAESASAASW